MSTEPPPLLYYSHRKEHQSEHAPGHFSRRVTIRPMNSTVNSSRVHPQVTPQLSAPPPSPRGPPEGPPRRRPPPSVERSPRSLPTSEAFLLEKRNFAKKHAALTLANYAAEPNTVTALLSPTVQVLLFTVKPPPTASTSSSAMCRLGTCQRFKPNASIIPQNPTLSRRSFRRHCRFCCLRSRRRGRRCEAGCATCKRARETRRPSASSRVVPRNCSRAIGRMSANCLHLSAGGRLAAWGKRAVCPTGAIKHAALSDS